MRLALRILARRPTVPLLIATLFALGIGLASGMWAVVDAALLRPVPYRDGAALVAVMEAHPQLGLMAVTPADFLDWSTRVNGLRDAAGLYAVDISLAGGGPPERVAGTKVTERFFDVWGVGPALGRVLQRQDFTAREHVAVIGYGLWRRRFGGGEGAIGTVVRIDGGGYTVVGVMTAGFSPVHYGELWSS